MSENERVISVAIEDEVKNSYLNYAMSVIVSRALPDVRDGLKPVHRRILYAMHEMGVRHNQPFKKCGRIVGDVLGKYHPHGDLSIHNTLVRLAQDFSLRYPLVLGQGNFGSIDGDPPAAMRYIEAKMARMAGEMLADIQKETVDYAPNYDDSLQEPTVLPGLAPNLLLNGSSGIAVGMATNMPSHNLNEVVDAIVAYIDNREIGVEQLMQYIKGPDFPTGGIIFGAQGIRDAFRTGRGKIMVRGRCALETMKNGREMFIISEIPYGVIKKNLIERIAAMAQERKIEGISDLRDESGRDGMRIVIELKRGAMPKIVLNKLFSLTQLQQSFNCINLALVNGEPKLLTLRDMIRHFVDHRREIIERRSRFDLGKAEERAHILEGLKRALDNIDAVIAVIKESAGTEAARGKLMKRFDFSERQAQAILDMRLQRLTALETEKIIVELNEVNKLIDYLKDLLASADKILLLIKEQTLELKSRYGDERRTEIVPTEIGKFDIEDLIQKEDMVVLISNKGFIKRMAAKAFRSQGRGGKGSSSTNMKDEEYLQHLFIGSTHDHILFITSRGKAYWIKVHEIPEGSKLARGSQVKTLINVSPDEDITEIVALPRFSDDSYIFMATRRGVVKKVPTSNFSNAKTRGIIAIKLDADDALISAELTDGKKEVMLTTRKGLALRVGEEQVRSQGRASRGVCGLKIAADDELCAVITINDNEDILVISENGYGKRVAFDNFTPHNRATRGQTIFKISDKSGELRGALSVNNDDNLLCTTSQGTMLKVAVKNISRMGKAAQGVRIVNITAPDYLMGVAKEVLDKNEETGIA